MKKGVVVVEKVFKHDRYPQNPKKPRNFSLTISFNIDKQELERKYLEFQQEFHPDNSDSADIEKSISINESYAVLKNPIKRASYILQLNGINLENDSESLNYGIARKGFAN